jgi:hypothetical protein
MVTTADNNNCISWGWLPKKYHSALTTRLRAAKRRRATPVETLSAASLLHESRKTYYKAWNDHVIRPQYTGHHHLRLGPRRRPIRVRASTTTTFIDHCADNPSLLARLARAITGHALIVTYYRRFPHIGKGSRCPSLNRHLHLRNHILNSCSYFSRYWEAWLDHSAERADPLQEFVEFLQRNKEAFSFSRGPPTLALHQS